MSSRRLLCIAAICLIGGCSDGDERRAAPELSEASLPGVYSGVFPCEGCPGIPTTLWLRPDGRFFIEQRYPDTDTRAAFTSHGLGRWSWNSTAQLAVLKGSGPDRSFARPDVDTVDMQTDSDLEHRLSRERVPHEFSAVIRMTGIARMRGREASFTECLTGFAAPVTASGDFARFAHQYRSAGAPGTPVPVELDGRFTWTEDGELKALTIERFVTVKDDAGC